MSPCIPKVDVRPCTIPNCGTSCPLRYCVMAKKAPEKKALKAIDKAVRKAIKSGISGGLVEQTVATSIHAATVKAARKAAPPKKNDVDLERANSPRKSAKAGESTTKVDGGN